MALMQITEFDFDYDGYVVDLRKNGQLWEGEIRDQDGAVLHAFAYLHDAPYPGELRLALNFSDREGLTKELWAQVWRAEHSPEAVAVQVELGGEAIVFRQYRPGEVWVAQHHGLLRYVHGGRRNDAVVEGAHFPESAQRMLGVRVFDAVTAAASAE